MTEETELASQPEFRTVIEEVLHYSVVGELADIAAGNLDKEEFENLVQFIGVIRASGQYMYMTADGLELIATAVANRPLIRRFVLSLYERVVFTAKAYDIVPTFVSDYSSIICKLRSSYRSSTSFIPPELQSTLVFTGTTYGQGGESKELDKYLEDNPWLVTLYMAIFTSVLPKYLNSVFEQLSNSEKQS